MRKAADILKAIFEGDQIRLAERYASLFDGWRKLVGDDIAAHSRVKDIAGCVLVVETDHPGWLQMIRLKEKKVLAALRKKYPELEIQTIKIYVAHGDTRGDRKTDRRDEGRRETSSEAPAGTEPVSDDGDRGPDSDGKAQSEPEREEKSAGRSEFDKTLERLRKLGRTDES